MLSDYDKGLFTPDCLVSLQGDCFYTPQVVETCLYQKLNITSQMILMKLFLLMSI